MTMHFKIFMLLLAMTVSPGIFILQGEEVKPAQASEDSKQKLNLQSVPEIAIDPESRKLIDDDISQRNYQGAANRLLQLIEKNPNSPQLLVTMGRVLFLDGQFLNSAIAFKKAEKLHPLKEEDRFTVAMCFVKLERRDWAQGELQKLAQANMKNPLYPYWLARLDYDDTKYAAAVEKLKITIELDPKFVRAYDNLGLCYEGLGQFEEAIKNYEKARELNRQQKPSSPWPPLNYGILLLGRGNLEEAEACLREALSYDPKLPQVHFQLGTLEEKQKKYGEAIEEMNLAISLDPSYPEPHYGLSRLYRTSGDLKAAEAAAATFQKLKQEKRKGKPQ